MIEKICLSKIAPKYAKARKADPSVLSRVHYLRFLREENKFFDSSDRLGGYINDWSLKAIPEFFKSIGHFTKMFRERIKSGYYIGK